MKRRTFNRQGVLATLALSTFGIPACQKKEEKMAKETTTKALKISLAQWSHHKEFFDGTMDPKDFARIAKQNYDISAVEYVNQFYTDYAEDASFWKELRNRAEGEGVQSLHHD